MAETLALPDLLSRAGAVMTERDGSPVAAHYGSAAGELAVCQRSVGLAARSDLVVLRISGTPRMLDHQLERALGHSVAPGGATLEAGAWWSRSPLDDELVVVCRRWHRSRLAATLRAAGDDGDDTVVNVIGRRTNAVLAELGVFGPARNPQTVSPFCQCFIGGHPVTWLLEGPTGALALVPRAVCASVWRTIDDAGHAHGISCVGLESIERFILLERASRSASTLL